MESSQRHVVLNDLSHSTGNPCPSVAASPQLDARVIDELGHHDVSLLEADGGKDAWLFLAAAFVVEALVWGFPFSFGVFQEYYSTHEPFASEPSSIAVIGTTATGVMYMAGLLLFPAYKTWPRLAVISKWAGLPIMAAGLIAGSFANNVNQLILTQGALYAFGGCVVYYPTLLFIDDWFIQRKGLAYGILWAGTGTAGLIIPFALNTLLESHGFRTTLRIWAGVLTLLSAPLISFLRPRLPPSASPGHAHSLRFLRTPTFWMLETGLIVESLGYFMPGIYLPVFARALGLGAWTGPLLVALANAAGVVSTVVMGMLCDRMHVTTVVLLCSAGAAAAVLGCWGLATALPLLCVFSVMYGFFAGGFVSTNAGMIKLVRLRDEATDVGTLIGVISAGRGIGAVVSGPLSELLLREHSWEGVAAFGYGSRYGALILFTGITAAVGGVSFLGKKLGWM